MTRATDHALVHPSLLADMRLALFAEFGARSLYGRLAQRVRDPELAQVLARFHEEEASMIEALRGLLADLGLARVPTYSRRRAALAWCLAFVSRGRSSSLALRACLDSEAVIARWYGEYARYLADRGLLEQARKCHELAGTKLRHARILEAWVPR